MFLGSCLFGVINVSCIWPGISFLNLGICLLFDWKFFMPLTWNFSSTMPIAYLFDIFIVAHRHQMFSLHFIFKDLKIIFFFFSFFLKIILRSNSSTLSSSPDSLPFLWSISWWCCGQRFLFGSLKLSFPMFQFGLYFMSLTIY